MVVVEDQQQVVSRRLIGQLVDHGPSPAARTTPAPAGRAAGPPARRSPAAPGPARATSMAPEPRRVIVARVQRQPRKPATGHRRAQSASTAVLPNPAGALTRMSCRASPSPSASTSRGRGTNPGCGPGTCKLGGQQHILPGQANPSRGRHGLVSHRRPTAQRQPAILPPAARCGHSRLDAPPPAASPRSGRALHAATAGPPAAVFTLPALSALIAPHHPLRAGLQVPGRRGAAAFIISGGAATRPVTPSCQAPSRKIPPHAHLRVTTRPGDRS